MVIPTVGRLATLQRVLEHLAAQTDPEFELIVVADAALQRTADVTRLVDQAGLPARMQQAAIPGASAARNAGWRAAQAPLLLFTDDDVLADPRLIEEHLRWHERNPSPEVGVLGHVRWARELQVTPFMRWLDHGIQFDYSAIVGDEAGWAYFYTANVSVKRELVERAGGFDEDRLPYLYEDLDLALRMHRADGFRLLYNRAARAEHLQATDLDLWKRRTPRLAASERQFVRMHPEIPPYFHDLFADAATQPPVGRRGERLARFIPGRVPLLGPYVWSRADLYYRQALAGPFLEAWAGAPAHSPSEPRTSVSSGGAPPAGPK